MLLEQQHHLLLNKDLSLETNLEIKIPFKVSYFMGLVIRRACLTHEALQRRGCANLLKVFSLLQGGRGRQSALPTLQNNCKSVEHVFM